MEYEVREDREDEPRRKPVAPATGQAGVSLESGEESVRRIRERVRATFGPRVESEIGAFAGFFSYPDPGSERLLVAAWTAWGRSSSSRRQPGAGDGVGYDIVSHCVNDILVHGARPLFFLDYIGAGKLSSRTSSAELVEGMAEACREAGCALIGGETAEMPGMYPAGELDLVGHASSARSARVASSSTAARVAPGTASSALASRRPAHERLLAGPADRRLRRAGPGARDERCRGRTTRSPSAAPARHRMYLPADPPAPGPACVHGMAHITGRRASRRTCPRVLPPGLPGAWSTRDLGRSRRSSGDPGAGRRIAEEEMLRVFNMGIGFSWWCRRAERSGRAWRGWAERRRSAGRGRAGARRGVVWDPE